MEIKNNRVFAIGAHPDDIEFMCSGTLKLLKDRGFDIFIGIVANGDCGSVVTGLDETTLIRKREAEDAAELLGAVLYRMGEADLRIYFDDKTKMKVTEYIRIVDPLIVFTHPHHDYIEDHEVTSKLVRHGCFASPIPNYVTFFNDSAPRTEFIPYLYYFATIDSRDIYGRFVPQSIYVDITSVIDFKADMLSKHKSQRDWLMKQHGMDKYIESMKNTAKLYGSSTQFDYAEGFIQHRGNAFPRDNMLKRILGDLIKENV